MNVKIVYISEALLLLCPSKNSAKINFTSWFRLTWCSHIYPDRTGSHTWTSGHPPTPPTPPTLPDMGRYEPPTHPPLHQGSARSGMVAFFKRKKIEKNQTFFCDGKLQNLSGSFVPNVMMFVKTTKPEGK